MEPLPPRSVRPRLHRQRLAVTRGIHAPRHVARGFLGSTNGGDEMDATHALDALTNAVTAFRTWGELVESLNAGYVPTIRPTTRRKRLLARALRAAGFRVFDGMRTW